LLASVLQSIATAYVHAPIVSIVVFSLISTTYAAQVPNMNLVTPKVALVALATIEFPSSSPFANGPTPVFATISIIIPAKKVIASSLIVPPTIVPSSL
jgi:hypothetical protein